MTLIPITISQRISANDICAYVCDRILTWLMGENPLIVILPWLAEHKTYLGIVTRSSCST